MAYVPYKKNKYMPTKILKDTFERKIFKNNETKVTNSYTRQHMVVEKSGQLLLPANLWGVAVKE